jgi:hypothetical protein
LVDTSTTGSYYEICQMSIWQNFKETDHSFEKKFFRAIVMMGATVALLFFADRALNKVPHVRKLFTDHGNSFIFFSLALVVIFFISFIAYTKTLDFVEAETKVTITISVISVIVWSVFWTAWSIYCAWLTLNFRPMSLSVILAILILVTVPGLIAFFFSKDIRRQQIKEEEDDKKSTGDNNFEPYTLCLDKKYYSGYYGLICLPVYLVSLLAGYIYSIQN